MYFLCINLYASRSEIEIVLHLLDKNRKKSNLRKVSLLKVRIHAFLYPIHEDDPLEKSSLGTLDFSIIIKKKNIMMSIRYHSLRLSRLTDVLTVSE